MLGFTDILFDNVELDDGEIVSVFGTDVAIGEDDCVKLWTDDPDTVCDTVFVLGNDVTIGDELIVVDCVADNKGVCESVYADDTDGLFIGLGVGVMLRIGLFVLYVDILVVGVG